jgi:hypothetical protein
MSSGVVSEHLMAEVDRHHPVPVCFEQPADRAGSGGDIEDQAAGGESYPTNHEPSPTPILAQAQDAGPTLIVPGYVPKQPRCGRLGFLFGTNRFDEDILVGSQRTGRLPPGGLGKHQQLKPANPHGAAGEGRKRACYLGWVSDTAIVEVHAARRHPGRPHPRAGLNFPCRNGNNRRRYRNRLISARLPSPYPAHESPRQPHPNGE